MVALRWLGGRVSFRVRPKTLGVMVLMSLLMVLLWLLSIGIGSYALSMQALLDEVMSALGMQGPIADSQAALVMWELRLPRSLAALLAGGLFALSGALLQNLTRNPLADPSLVGISQGAAFAVVCLTMLFPEAIDAWREVSAFTGAMVVAAGVQSLSGSGHPLKFILMGIGVAAFFSALTSSLLTYGDIDAAMSALAWLSGSVHAVTWSEVGLLSIALLTTLVLAIGQARNMAALSFGVDMAVGLGVNSVWASRVQLMLSVCAAALATAIVGPIGFVGLLAPHMARKMTIAGPNSHLILTTFVGASLVLFADTLGRTLFAPTQLAAGLVTALIGAPLFALLLMRKQQG